MRELKERTITDSEYRALAEFRHHIRRYLDFSDQLAKELGLEPKQYQLMLAIKGLPEGVEPTVGALAHQLAIRHHSAVELTDRAEANGLVERVRTGTYAFVHLTKQGERILARAVEERLEELRVAGPILVKALQKLLNSNDMPEKKRK
jgi:DNA-binding MarR family transcriptional regulator